MIELLKRKAYEMRSANSRDAISLFLFKTPHSDFSHAHFTVGRRWLLFISARAMENYHYRRAGFFNTRLSVFLYITAIVYTLIAHTTPWFL